MGRVLLLLLFCLCILQTYRARAQYYFYNDKYYYTDWLVELGGSAGIMNSLTDLGGKKGTGRNFTKDLNWQMTKPAFSIYGVATYKDAIGLRLEAGFGTIQSYDSVLRKVGPSTFGRYERNLSFKTHINEIQLGVELHPLFFKPYNEDEAPFWSPYLVAGIGYFWFNPEAKLNNQWYYLHPLHTEGEGFKEYPGRKVYKLNQVNVPLGMGVRYELSALVNIRLELLYRILFTDYLDDVSHEDYVDPAVFSSYLTPQQAAIARQLADRRSVTLKGGQRGNPKENDAFFTIQFKIGICLRPLIRSH